MSILENQANKFEALKKANSPWLSIESGESVHIESLRAMKADTKTDDKTGVTSAVMSFDVDVMTEEGLKVKKLNTSSSKLIQLFVENKIDIGSSFTLTKHGESFSTTYEVTDVVNKVKEGATTAQAVTENAAGPTA